MIKNSFPKIYIKSSLKLYFKKTLIFGTLIAVILSFSGCFLIPKEEEVLAPPLKEPPKVVFDTWDVVKGTFERRIDVTGYMKSVTQKDLNFRNFSGRLKTIYVEIGDKVEKGKLLAELITDDLESQIRLQEISLKKAQLLYDKTDTADDLSNQIKLQEISLEKMQNDRAKATEELGDQIKLQEINLKKVQMNYNIAVASEDAQVNIDRSKLEVDAENARLEDLKNKLTEINSAKSKLDVEAEKLRLEILKNNLVQLNNTKSKLDVDAEKVKLDDLKNKLSLSKLVSPISGNVVYITDTKEGSIADAYSTIVTIADPKDLQVSYDGDKVSEFELGMKVSVKINDTELQGKVVMTPSDVPFDADEKTKSSIRIKLDKLPGDIAIGDSASISLIQIKKENVIVINKNLIHTVGERKFVNIIENGLKKERDIETGDENIAETIVVKGLSEGDKIIIN